MTNIPDGIRTSIAQIALASVACAIITSGAVLGAFDRILMPSIRETARAIAREAVAAHLVGPPHPSAANQQDISYIRERLQNMPVRADLEMVSVKLEALSARIEALEAHHRN